LALANVSAYNAALLFTVVKSFKGQTHGDSKVRRWQNFHTLLQKKEKKNLAHISN
jgi:hypothetical protein